MQKSKLIIFVLVVCLIAISSFLYISNLNSQKQSASNNTKIDQTTSDDNKIKQLPTTNTQESKPIPSDWKAYENKELGFSMSYPSDWTEKDNVLNDYQFPEGANFISQKRLEDLQKNRKEIEDYYGSPLEDHLFHLSDIGVSRYASVKEAHGEDSIDNVIKNNNEVKKVGEIQIDGVNAVETIMSGEYSIYVIMFENKGYYYEIRIENIDNKESVPETQKQMISSFRFIN